MRDFGGVDPDLSETFGAALAHALALQPVKCTVRKPTAESRLDHDDRARPDQGERRARQSPSAMPALMPPRAQPSPHYLDAWPTRCTYRALNLIPQSGSLVRQGRTRTERQGSLKDASRRGKAEVGGQPHDGGVVRLAKVVVR